MGDLGQNVLRPAEMMFKTINASGGILGIRARSLVPSTTMRRLRPSPPTRRW
jgi:hypothetical protein